MALTFEHSSLDLQLIEADRGYGHDHIAWLRWYRFACIGCCADGRSLTIRTDATRWYSPADWRSPPGQSYEQPPPLDPKPKSEE